MSQEGSGRGGMDDNTACCVSQGGGVGVWMITLLFKPERGSGGMDDNRMFTAIVLA